MTTNHGKNSIIFVANKVVAQTSILIINNRRQKNFEDKTENSAEIKVNTTHFLLIIKGI